MDFSRPPILSDRQRMRLMAQSNSNRNPEFLYRSPTTEAKKNKRKKEQPTTDLVEKESRKFPKRK